MRTVKQLLLKKQTGEMPAILLGCPNCLKELLFIQLLYRARGQRSSSKLAGRSRSRSGLAKEVAEVHVPTSTSLTEAASDDEVVEVRTVSACIISIHVHMYI